MTETIELIENENSSATHKERPPIGATPRRIRIAEALAFVAVVAAVLAALGPAERIRTTYSWPPSSLPEGTPSRIWYTPLLLSARIPEIVSADLPCSPTPALRSARSSVTVLATARFPERAGGLAVRRNADRLTVGVGDNVLVRLVLAGGPSVDSDCDYLLQLRDGRWSLEGGPDQIVRSGELEFMPIVNGIFSELDLRSDVSPSVEITTEVHATRASARQTIGWIVAALAAVTALLLVAIVKRPTWPWRVAKTLVGSALGGARAADATVAVVLAGWWVLAPANYDDGWTIARQHAFTTSGGFSNYYDSLGANLPLGYWLEWTQHWLTQSSDSLLVLRVPALLCLAATWVLCRWILARVLTPTDGADRLLVWSLATTFLVGAMAWGMTLRLEPQVTVLVTAVVACTVYFVERNSNASIALLGVLVPLALTAQPVGILSLAPLFVVATKLLRWSRTAPAVAATIFASSVALLIVLVAVGSDLAQRLHDAQMIATYGNADPWREEITRYASLVDYSQYSAPLRRASVALMGLAVLAYLMRPRGRRSFLLDLPSASIGVALLLLVATPSKLHYHFGALIGLAAVAVAAETARIRSRAARPPRRLTRPLLAVGAAILATAWCWSLRSPWNVADLRTLDWTPAFEGFLPVSALAVALPFALLAGAALIARVRRRENVGYEASWRVASWTAPVLAVPLIVFTIGVLAADVAKTDSWTLARQNLATFHGGLGCGLADDLRIPDANSARPLTTVASAEGRSEPAWVPAVPVAGLPVFALGPASNELVRSPWFGLPAKRDIGLLVAGEPGPTDRLALEWGRLRDGRVESLGTDQVSREFAIEAGSILPWRFVVAGELPPPQPRANVVRVVLRSDIPPGPAIAVTAPVTYLTKPLALRLEGTTSKSLLHPRMATYFPCAELPRLSDGLVEVPRQIVTERELRTPIRYSFASPFDGLLDLYWLERLPIADSTNPPDDIVVLGVNRRIPGAKLAPPAKKTIVSQGIAASVSERLNRTA
jgi:arabinosyltransferase A